MCGIGPSTRPTDVRSCSVGGLIMIHGLGGLSKLEYDFMSKSKFNLVCKEAMGVSNFLSKGSGLSND